MRPATRTGSVAPIVSRGHRLGLSPVIALAAVVTPSIAYAHVGFGPTSGWVHGFWHPISGLDHVCAMIAVGLLAAQRGGRALWALPLSFLCAMTGGALLGATGGSMPFAEGGVLLSVLLLGVLVVAALPLPLLATALVVGVFAAFHGHVHGTEMPATVSGAAYAAGFIAATATLHATGIGIALHARGRDSQLARYAGAFIMICGAYLSLLSLS
jgi:urease accessory protein